MHKLTAEDIKEFVRTRRSDTRQVAAPDADWARLSIITISLNQAAFIERTILSVLNQNYPNLEYIVIDGGSTDGSQRIIEHYANSLAVFVSEPDDGTSDAVNKGLSRATGDVVGLQCSDDIYLPGAFLRAVEHFRSDPAIEILFSNRLDVDPDDNIVGESRFTSFSLIGHLYEGMAISPQSMFIKRCVFERIGMFEMSLDYANDYEFFARAARSAVSFKHVRDCFGAIRRHPMSRTYVPRSPQMLEAVDRIWAMYKRRALLAPVLKPYAMARRTVRYALQGDVDYVVTGATRRIAQLIRMRKRHSALGC